VVDQSLSLLTDVAYGIIFAAAASHVARLFRQPLILGYVLGGVLLGTHLGFGLVTNEANIELISEIGLILLLFIIGMEINLRELVKMGKSMFTLGIVQISACVVLGLLAFRFVGYRIGNGNFDLLYIAVAAALSSTLIVVKLLHDKFEIHTVAGRLTVGVLVLQDVGAIIFMACQPNLLNPQLGNIAQSLGFGVVLVVTAFVASRHLLSRLFLAASKSPELVLLTSIAWCFFIAGLAEIAGLSKEMGALIAGMSIAAFPYGTAVIGTLSGVRDFFVTLFFVSLGLKVPVPTWQLLKISLAVAAFVLGSRLLSVAPTVYFLRMGIRIGTLSGVRDFFVTLFFVSLGLKVPVPTWQLLKISLAIAAFVLGSRLLSVAPTVYFLRMGIRNGLLTALNLAQMSEFSLVITALGANYGHVSEGLSSTVLASMLVTSILATYIINFNDTLTRALMRAVPILNIQERGVQEEKTRRHEGPKRDIVLLGCYRDRRCVVCDLFPFRHLSQRDHQPSAVSAS